MNLYPTYTSNHLLDPFFDEIFGIQEGLTSENHGSLSMRTDIRQEGDGYMMFVDLPGIKKENIGLSYEDGQMTISVKTNTIEKDEKGNLKPFVRRERFSGSASRSYYIGDVDETKIKAEYKDGVLMVYFPDEKKEEIVAHNIAIN